MHCYRYITAICAALLLFGGIAVAQSKRQTKTIKKPVAAAVSAPTPSPTPTQSTPIIPEPKKNERPTGNAVSSGVERSTKSSDPAYSYEFSQPDFMISKIVIEHDATGRGTITFTKKMFGDTVSDPIVVSGPVLERINGAYAALRFLDSNESYQYEKDYSHLGVMTFRLKQGGKERTAVFNYTENKDAKLLADEYRKLGNQFIWVFDIALARENQPLEAPKLLDSLDALLKRNEIADPMQMVPLLRGLKDDERVPLIARNHATKLADRIEKGKK
jgi:hypothetical protein